MENEIVKSAVSYISDRDEEFARKMRKDGLAHAVYGMLRAGGFDLQNLHRTGDLRRIIGMFL